MNQTERMLAEAVRCMFGNDPATLGIIKGKPISDPTSRMPHQYEHIQELFALKVGDSVFYESLRSAFYDIHSYKYINDPNFCLSLTTRLKSIGVPYSEIRKACGIIEEIKKELGGKHDDWNEGAAGWHRNLKGIKASSQEFNEKPKHKEPYSGGGPWPLEEDVAKLANITKEMIADATPGQLIEMLLARAVRDLKEASKLFAFKGDPRSQADAIHLIVHAQQIITELNRALDTRQPGPFDYTRDGRDLITNLGRIYEYMQHRLTDAVKNRDVNIVDEILGLLTELLDTWASIGHATTGPVAAALAKRPSKKLNKEPHDPAGDLRRDEEEGERLGDTSDGGY